MGIEQRELMGAMMHQTAGEERAVPAWARRPPAYAVRDAQRILCSKLKIGVSMGVKSGHKLTCLARQLWGKREMYSRSAQSMHRRLSGS